MKYGDDLNAFNSFDRTVYKIDVPADRPEALAKAIQVLKEWGDHLTFDPAEVEKEKVVII